MANFLLDSKPLENVDVAYTHGQPTQDGIFDGTQYDNKQEDWKNLLVPEEMKGKMGTLPLDLNTLLKVLDQHNKDVEDPNHSTWQLVLIQGVLLFLLVLVSVCWACCCRRKCFRSTPPTVQEALRKLSSTSTKSRDFPPSYSQADLHTLAMSVHDYLYPPPQYPDILSRSCNDLAYLDLENGHRRMSKLSFSGTSSPVIPGYPSIHSGAISPVIQGHPALSRQTSVLSSGSESRKSSISVDSTGTRKNSIMKDPSSRRSSLSQDSRRSSRVSFSEAVECSNGSFRRLSGSQDLSRKSSSSSLSSEGSRKSSSSLLLSRKLGLSQETLDKELRKKLEAIEKETEEEIREPRDSSLETVIEIEKY